MYSPEAFKVEDRATLHDFLRQHNFATLVTQHGGGLQATHVPLVLKEEVGEQGALQGHLARANQQWRDLALGNEVLVIFTGPHAYISPAWYQTSPAVPTWNYTAVHVYGLPRLVEDSGEFAAMLHELVEVHERDRPDRWSGEMPVEFRDRLMKGIVGFEIAITRIEGKFKLSQNRPDDAPGVIDGLSQSPYQGDREVAELMRRIVPDAP
jgi:transcriptional regulator